MTPAPSQVSIRGAESLPEVTDPERLDRRCAAFLAAVGLPRAFVRQRRVLQIGGFAESALQFALWGGEVTILESSPTGGERAERLFLRHRQRLRVESREELLSDSAAMARFDFVVCEEPLLTSPDPVRNLDVLLANLTRDAVVLVALPESRGWKRRTIMRRIVKQIADNDEERARFARASFPRHVEATARRRGCEEATALRDTFVSAAGRAADLSEICAVFSRHEMEYLGSSPNLRAFASGADLDPFDYAANARRYRVLEDAWEALAEDGRDGIAGGLSHLETAIARELDALREIDHRVARRDVDDAMLRALDCGGFVDRFVVVAAKR